MKQDIKSKIDMLNLLSEENLIIVDLEEMEALIQYLAKLKRVLCLGNRRIGNIIYIHLIINLVG